MLHNASILRDDSIHAADGSIGLVKDVYYDEPGWTIRYFVVDVGNWIPGRLVLLGTEPVVRLDDAGGEIHVRMTRAEIKNSPGVDARLPLSRRREQELRAWYGWTVYWPQGAEDTRAVRELQPSPEESDLRSVEETIGYSVHARDGEIGRIEDLLFDDEHWAIRYLVVNTRPWWPGGKVIVSPQWIEGVDRMEMAVHTGLSRDDVRHSPPYDPSRPVDAAYEERLHEHYVRPTAR